MKKNRKKRSISQKYIFGVKAIADYLNISERNVYLWEKELNFPLHRVGDANKRTVYASADEIERWLRKRPLSQSTKRGKRTFTLGLLIVFGAGIIFILVWIFLITKSDTYDFYLSSFPNPTNALMQDKNVYIKNRDGEVIWNYIESGDTISNGSAEKEKNLDFFDIDHDQANEVIAREYDPETDRFYLTLFDNNGARVWQNSIINDRSFRGLLLRSNFYPMFSQFAQGHRESFIITAWRHKTRFLVIITRYDIRGHLLNEYIHTGHLSFLLAFDLNQDGTHEILFGATNNLLNGEAVLGILDLKDFKGICPPNRIEPEYHHLKYLLQRYIGDEAELGNQIAYIRFKKTNHFIDHTRPYAFPIFDHSDENLFHIYISPWGLGYEDILIGFEYVFNNRLKLMDIIPTPGLRKFKPILFQDSQEDVSIQDLNQIYAENILGWKQGRWVSLDELDLNLDH